MKAKKSITYEQNKGIEKINLLYKEKIILYERIFSKLNAIIFVFDLNELRMLWVNDGFKKILGYKKTTQKVPESLLFDIYHPNDRDMLKDMQAFFKQNKTGTFTAIFQFRNIKGEYIWLCTAASVFRKNDSASIMEIVGVSLNFSNDLVYDKNAKVITRKILHKKKKEVVSVLTKREKELLKYFVSGLKTREIAEQIGLSFHTVNNHRKNILKKLNMKNIASLVNFAAENGLT